MPGFKIYTIHVSDPNGFSDEGQAVRATYDEAIWSWTAKFSSPNKEWGDVPPFLADDPFHALGAATAWLAAKFYDADLPADRERIARLVPDPE